MAVNNTIIKNKKSLSTKTCDIVFDDFVEKETISKLICEIWKYFVYDRDQIPFPMDSARQRLDKVSCGEARNGNGSAKKKEMIMQMINECENVLSSLECLLSYPNQAIIQVCLLFGSSIHLPKEIYLIQMPDELHYLTNHSCPVKPITLRSAYTRFIRIILENANILFHSRPKMNITKMHFMVQLRRESVPNVARYVEEKLTHETDVCVPINDFELPKAFRHQFKFIIKMNTHKCEFGKSVGGGFKIYSEEDNLDQVNQLASTLEDKLDIKDDDLNAKIDDCEVDDDLIWMSVGSVKGVKLNNNDGKDLDWLNNC